jgi:transcriptional regulator with XRE-family HTH domain
VSPVSVSSIGEYIRQQREQAKISLRQLASAAGISNPYLSQVERGLRRPSAEILQQIAKGLRISAEALYVQAGILEDRRPDSGVRAAVLADPELAERQKQVLLEIYESFRRETALEAEATAETAADAEAAGQGPRSAGTGPGGTGSETTSSETTSSVATGSVATGSVATGSGSTGSGSTRIGSTRKGSTGAGSKGPGAGAVPTSAIGPVSDAARDADAEPDGTEERAPAPKRRRAR